MTIRFIPRYVTVSREIVIVATHTIIPQIIFQNGKPIIMLYNIINIWKNSPWPATSRSIIGVNIKIMPITCGGSTGKVIISSGKWIKEGIIKLAGSCEYEYLFV